MICVSVEIRPVPTEVCHSLDPPSIHCKRFLSMFILATSVHGSVSWRTYLHVLTWEIVLHMQRDCGIRSVSNIPLRNAEKDRSGTAATEVRLA